MSTMSRAFGATVRIRAQTTRSKLMPSSIFKKNAQFGLYAAASTCAASMSPVSHMTGERGGAFSRTGSIPAHA